MPRAGSDSGGGVIGGISNSSSPRLGVWNVCKIKGNKNTHIFTLCSYSFISPWREEAKFLHENNSTARPNIYFSDGNILSTDFLIESFADHSD